MTLDLHNFFKFYDEKNSNHVAAVQWLEDNLPAEFLDDAETDWIGMYRTKPPTPAVLEVPYFNQVDNYRDAHRTCNSSSCAMVQTKVLAGYGVKSHFSYNLSFADVDKSLDAGKPVVIGILHRGSLSAPTGGHMCVVIGKTPDGKGYFVNDPYGSLNDNYTGPVTNGKKTIYTKAVLKHRWCPGGNDGWGRIFD